MHSLGLLFSLGALLSWAFGDFMIQRASRAVGSIKTLFFIGIFGNIVLLPFVSREIPALLHNSHNVLLLVLTIGITLFAALFDFEALKEGKFAVIQPIFGLELPLTVGLSMVLRNEHLSSLQFILVAASFLGILLAIIEGDFRQYKDEKFFEKGVILAGIGVVGMGLTNFITAVSSQETDSPLLTIWVIHSGLALICFCYMMARGQLRSIATDFRKSPWVLVTAALDNAAWIFFSYAVIYIPISIATTISESYIAIGVLLGVFVNKEKIKKHQIFGIILAIVGIILLSLVTKD